MLNQSSKYKKRLNTGVKHSDLHLMIRTMKCTIAMSFKYKHVRAHSDKLKPWLRLSLEEQLNVICNELANGAIKCYLSSSMPVTRNLQLLPPQKAVVFVGTKN